MAEAPEVERLVLRLRAHDLADLQLLRTGLETETPVYGRRGILAVPGHRSMGCGEDGEDQEGFHDTFAGVLTKSCEKSLEFQEHQ